MLVGTTTLLFQATPAFYNDTTADRFETGMLVYPLPSRCFATSSQGL